jgi:Prolyl oligopeptidase family
LEDRDDPRMQAWRNARTRAYLDASPRRAAVAIKLSRLIKVASPSKQRPSLVTMGISADPRTHEPLVDPNRMVATLPERPGLARAVVSSSGIHDMMRFELDPNGVFNATEFGMVKDPHQFRALHACSPLHHVTPGTHYPAVLMLTGANDGRVTPTNPRKFAAALQATQVDQNQPILLRTSHNSGHRFGSSLDDSSVRPPWPRATIIRKMPIDPKLPTSSIGIRRIASDLRRSRLYGW